MSSSSQQVRGACLCGAVGFTVTLPTLFCGHCHCTMCRRNHGAGFVTWIAVPRTQVSVDRGDGEQTQLTDKEIAGFASLLGGAGAETVTKLVANAVVLFDRHPDQWQRLSADPECIPGAVEEVLRYLPPSQYQGRFSFEERTFEGGTIPAGFPVLLVTGAATRDPRAFERPDDFDISRPPALSIGFGHGVHSCLGAALARARRPATSRLRRSACSPA